MTGIAALLKYLLVFEVLLQRPSVHKHSLTLLHSLPIQLSLHGTFLEVRWIKTNKTY